jgi:hypothetical protein
MSIIKQFFAHEISSVEHDLERVRKALKQNAAESEKQILDQLYIRKALVTELANHAVDESILLELTDRLLVAETAHHRTEDQSLSDNWWRTLSEIRILADLLTRLSHAVEEDYVPHS